MRFGLFGLRQRLGQHALLIGLRGGDGRFALGFSALDRRVALGLGDGDIGVASASAVALSASRLMRAISGRPMLVM